MPITFLHLLSYLVVGVRTVNLVSLCLGPGIAPGTPRSCSKFLWNMYGIIYIYPKVIIRSCRHADGRGAPRALGQLGRALQDGVQKLCLWTPEAFQEEKLEALPLQGRRAHRRGTRLSLGDVWDGDAGHRGRVAEATLRSPSAPGKGRN